MMIFTSISTPARWSLRPPGRLDSIPTEYFVVAHLKARMGTQYYDLTAEWQSLPRIRSVTVYRYSSDVREAYGTANLAER